MSNLISYSQLIKDRNDFRKAGGDFNKFDTPGLKFFKLFFYFNNGDSEGIANGMTSGGLLAPTWLLNTQPQNWHLYNSAWSYLKMNCEDERAEMLEEFVTLLSNVSSESPWYFTELGGLDAVLERKQAMEKDFKIDETRYKISIKCLPDAFDDRIATLLELYRSISWSWIKKQSVLPANLRKFDMGILVYEVPNEPFHKTGNVLEIPGLDNIVDTDTYSVMGSDPTSEYKSSYKYFELHNCEFDYSSGKGNLGSISNVDGLQPEYTIDIHFDDCFETRYNEFSFRTMGDIIETDMYYLAEYKGSKPDALTEASLKKKSDFYNQGMLANALNQVVGTGLNAVTSLAKKAILGNLFTFSLTKMVGQAKDLMQGDVWSTTRNVMEYVNDAKQRNESGLPAGHSLFGTPDSQFQERTDHIGTIFSEPKIRPTVKRIGNMHQANTLANNI